MKFTAFLIFAAGLWSACANAQAPEKPATTPARSSQADEPIDFEKAKGLLQKRQRGEKLSADEDAYLRKAIAARQRAGGGGDSRAILGKEKTHLKPLTEMTSDDRYEGQDGGLYGKGKNQPPEAHLRKALDETDRIEPLNSKGEPDPKGKIGLVSISMSNATQEFSTFKRIADADPNKSEQLVIVDCAQGGQAMAEWVAEDAMPWREAMRRLDNAKVSPEQVQVAWIKLANKGPRGKLEEHGRKLEKDTLAVIHNAKKRFPNLRIAYLSSRIYGGHSNGALNPEPYAYESAFPARWLIDRQIKGDSALDRSQAPILLWGPYLWANGVVPRKADQLVWNREDLAQDGTHPSTSGREKVARLLLEFFKNDPTAKPWFTK